MKEAGLYFSIVCYLALILLIFVKSFGQAWRNYITFEKAEAISIVVMGVILFIAFLIKLLEIC